MGLIKETRFQRDDVSLSGTLTLGTPDHGDVAVLMLHGSGPLDRDANMPGQDLNIFNAIAGDLDDTGISSFRYDKRGCGDSGGDYLTSGFTDLIKDACAAVDMLTRVPEIDKIVLLGHSEGTIIAPVVAHLKPQISGLIMLCPTVQPVEGTLMRQAERMESAQQEMRGFSGVMVRLFARMKGGMVTGQRRFIDQIKASDETSFRQNGQQVPAKMLKELLAHDLGAWIAKVQVPVLAISGAKDIQCLPSDVDLIKDMAQGPVEAHCLSDLTHLLRTDDAAPSFARYKDLMKQKLDPRVTELCINWILQQDFKE